MENLKNVTQADIQKLSEKVSDNIYFEYARKGLKIKPSTNVDHQKATTVLKGAGKK